MRHAGAEVVQGVVASVRNSFGVAGVFAGVLYRGVRSKSGRSHAHGRENGGGDCALSEVGPVDVVDVETPASQRKPCMCSERTRCHQNGARVGKGTHHSTRVPELKIVHPCMFSKVEAGGSGI